MNIFADGSEQRLANATAGGADSSIDVLGVRVDLIGVREALHRFEHTLLDRGCRVVHLCNAHNLLLAAKHERYRTIMNSGDLNLPDGAATVLAGWLLGARPQGRVAGADLLAAVCSWGVDRSVRHFFYGGTPASLEAMISALGSAYPGIKIAGFYAPPFRPLTKEETEEVSRTINEAGAQIVWVGLGTPKQDEWMEAFRGRLDGSVLVGIGAVFDFLSGTRTRAPRWMQCSGFEWLHRLGTEPRRLWRRYLVGNPEFVMRLAVSWARRLVKRTTS